ncbi:hypothetical protein HZ326_4583 [Fusarium oxysporum f. sp. albedinis]|nr:hypothetical protein HZ326_4583 [Fusarium oxysporum f. sp. albedinis]
MDMISQLSPNISYLIATVSVSFQTTQSSCLCRRLNTEITHFHPLSSPTHPLATGYSHMTTSLVAQHLFPFAISAPVPSARRGLGPRTWRLGLCTKRRLQQMQHHTKRILRYTTYFNLHLSSHTMLPYPVRISETCTLSLITAYRQKVGICSRVVETQQH